MWQVAGGQWQNTIGASGIQTTPRQLVVGGAILGATIGSPTINAERFEGAAATTLGGGTAPESTNSMSGEGRAGVLNHTGPLDGFATVFSVAPADRLAVAVTCTSVSAMR